MFKMFVLTMAAVVNSTSTSDGTRKTPQFNSPHIIFIVADDLGWNDVSFHGSNQIQTPNIDALAYSGLILHNYYVNPICTPSRSALMTGKYPIHTGMQHTVLFGAEPRGLPLNETLLPEYLTKLGYVSRMVGKWHLGSYKKDYTPTYRGFLSHFGCWTGHLDYNDHTAMEKPGWGLDMRRNLDVDYNSHGKYVTDLYTDEAVRVISEHNATRPLFLYLAHNAVHSGNPYNPLAAPDELVAQFSNISDYNRRRFAGVLLLLDESVGKVVAALGQRGMLNDSVIVFTTDNGGPAAGFNLNAASNWPLRGVKNTLWEGGVRGAALLWSPRLRRRRRIAQQRMHIVDWLPTLLHAAASSAPSIDRLIDGVDLWDELSNANDNGGGINPKRDTILHNIDDIYGSASLSVGEWKLIKGTNYEGAWDKWYGPSGRAGSYDAASVANSLAGKSLANIQMAATLSEMERLRQQANVVCSTPIMARIACQPLLAPCLFNLKKDPCEERNLAQVYPHILAHLEETLSRFNATAVPPSNRPLDPNGNPKYWNYVWTNFGDYKHARALSFEDRPSN